jgi:UDP-glucose 4-epimerase
MKLVVTGASGFIGHNVLLRAPRTWEIVAVYHRTSAIEAFVKAQGLSHVRLVRCNLLDDTDLDRLMQTLGGPADALLHLAANGDPAASAERPRWDLEANTLAFVGCLEHCPVDHVVYLSSGAVYDGLRGPVSPTTAVSPRLPYAISKLASEQYLRFFAERRGEVRSYVNVRFFGAYGPYEAPRKITTRWLQAMAAGQREFTVRGNGENLIDFMYVDDAVDAMLALVQAKGFSATVNLASNSPVTVNQVVAAMARALDVKVTVRHEGEVPEYIEFRSVDSTLREKFGFTPRVPFEEGLRRLHAFLSSSPPASAQATAGKPAPGPSSPRALKPSNPQTLKPSE